MLVVCFLILQETHDGYRTSDEFDKIYEQILQMKNLKLIVFDPLASFVHADVNSDPAAGAAFNWIVGTDCYRNWCFCYHVSSYD